ncbi:MAG TPA: choice-of-anchor tandem repeat GloVer-containing protein [Tepidisphaeraceae bacterium]
MLSAYTPNPLGSFGVGSPDNGEYPYFGVTRDAAGDLFGTTFQGGASGNGTVFEIAKGSNDVTALASFDGANGATPGGGLTIDAAGNLYGTTSAGGDAGDGSVFEIQQGTTSIQTLASFDGDDGSMPQGSIAVDSAGNIYGATQGGGDNGFGTVFEIARGSGAITALASFDGSNGKLLFGGVTLDPSGNLYGTTYGGGDASDGTVFEVAGGSNTITTLLSFDGPNGAKPFDTVTLDAAGNLYGTTVSGGPTNDGTIFEIANGSGTLTTLAAFDGINGSLPYARPAIDVAGNLYGTTYNGGAGGYGAAFELPSGSSEITDLLSFSVDGSEGTNPEGPLTLDATGNLYGTTSTGGSAGYGAVFELTTNSSVWLSLTSGANPSQSTQPLTFTATVSGGVPDGETVMLVDASNKDATVATGALNAGAATLAIPAGTFAAGTHDLLAVYSGDADYGASESPPYAQTVQGGVAPPPAWLAAGSQASWDPSTYTLTVTGSAVINADPGADEPNIVESGAAAQLVIQPTISPTDIHIGGVSLSNGAKLQVASVGSGRTHANHNVLVVGTAGSATDPTFSIDATSKLDLSDNDLVLHVGSSDANGTAAYNNVFAQAKIGRHGDAATPDGTWNGNGLDSSAATAVFNAQGYEQVALGVVDNNQLAFGSFSKWTVGSASESLGANDVIVKYTYVGDYALEGMVGDDNAGILQVEYDHGATNTHNWATGSSLWDGLADDNEAGVFQIQYGLGTGGKNRPQL